MVDCSHANSGKRHERQAEVVRDVAAQVASARGPAFTAAVFGGIISLMGCYQGDRSKGGAGGVGRAATLAVVGAAVLTAAPVGAFAQGRPAKASNAQKMQEAASAEVDGIFDDEPMCMLITVPVSEQARKKGSQ